MAFAELEAELFGHPTLGTQHVLISLCENDDGLTMAALGRAGARLPVVRDALGAAGAPSGRRSVDGLILGADTAAMLAAAGRLAEKRGDKCVVGRDLLHAVLMTDGAAARTLVDLKINLADVHEHAISILAGGSP
jgi:hypothetical protein